MVWSAMLISMNTSTEIEGEGDLRFRSGVMAIENKRVL